MDTYRIELRGQVDVEELNRLGPQQMALVAAGGTRAGEAQGEGAQEPITVLACCTDQSGMIGVLRYLHSMGYFITSVVRQAEPSI